MNSNIWGFVAIFELYLFVFFDQFFHDRESIGYINYLIYGNESKYNYTDFFDGLYYQPYLILLMQILSSIYIFRHFMPQIREKLNNFNNLSISIQLFPL